MVIIKILIIKKKFLIDLTTLLKYVSLSLNQKSDLILSLRTFQKTNSLSNFLFPRIPNFLLPIPIELFIIKNEEFSSKIFDIKKWKINIADLDNF